MEIVLTTFHSTNSIENVIKQCSQTLGKQFESNVQKSSSIDAVFKTIFSFAYNLYGCNPELKMSSEMYLK